MTFKRSERVAGLLLEEISRIIQFELKDPRLGFVTVTAVRVTDDLKDAKVYCGILGERAAREETLGVLSSAAAFIRREVGQRCRLRFTPALTFHLDDTAERAVRIEGLLRDLKEGRSPGGEPDRSGGPAGDAG